MQKLSRTDKYRDYRNKLNNDGEREIATKELRELQEKIIFNEKRFGSTSRTESDLNRGNKGIANSIFGDSNQQNNNSYENDLDDIFNELNRYKRYSSNQKIDTSEGHDDYIRKIKDIVNRSNVQNEKPNYREIIEEKPFNLEKVLFKEDVVYPKDQEEHIPSYEDQPIDKIQSIFVEDASLNSQSSSATDVIQKQNFEQKIEEIYPRQTLDEPIAEFEEKIVVEQPKSQLVDVEVKRADIKPTVPKHDHSKEFEEICMNVNSLAEEIDATNSFGEDQYTPPVSNHKPNNSFEGIQRNIKKDLIGSERKNDLFDNMEKELNQHKEDFPSEEKVLEDKKRIVKKSEISEEKKEEYDNTVSLQVNKLMGEINSSKADNISAADIIKGNDMAKKEVTDHPGKTIAFEINKKVEVPNNTLVLTNPSIEDSSIHTMSFKTENLDVENGEKGNTILNVILSILIIIAVGALGVIIYFFLITRGII